MRGIYKGSHLLRDEVVIRISSHDRSVMERLLNLTGQEVDFEIKKHREKRSLNANAYFHVLCHKLAQSQSPTLSDARMKNILITSYGQPEIIDDVHVCIKTNIDSEKMWEQEYLHCRPCNRQPDPNATMYYVYRGSHTYDSYEMAKLIDGTVQDCKDQGIETLSPKELERLVRQWQSQS